MHTPPALAVAAAVLAAGVPLSYRRSGGCTLKLSRRQILSTGPAAFVCASAAAQTSEEPQYVQVKTAYGRLRGLQGAGLVTFKGVPYAGSVSGAKRFKAAPPLKSWTGVRAAVAPA